MQKIVLASGSPRRKEILEMFDMPFESVTSEIEEKVDLLEKPEITVMSLALQKAIDVAKGMPEGTIVIGADTLVFNDTVLGKPSDEEDARKMLMSLQGKAHDVHTGFAIVKAGTHERVVDSVCTKVYIRPLDNNEIEAYIASGEVWGKAGAYAIQGIGAVIVERIEGDYFNVVGFPISRVSQVLKKHFNIQLLK